MTVYRVKDKWRAEVFVGGRRIASKSGFARQREAKEWHDATARAGPDEAKDCTFEDLLGHFKTWHLPSVRGGTKTRYLVDIDQRIEPYFRYRELNQISVSMVEQFKSEIAAKLSPKSVNNCLHTLRLMLNKGVRWKMLKESPYAVESMDIPDAPYAWWSDERDIHRFLEAAKSSRYFAVYLLALETGLRYGEIMGLAPRDVDLDQGTIHVHRQWLEREGKYGPPKHGRERWVDFNPDGELKRRLALQIRSSTVEALFTTATGAMPTRGGVAHKYFRAAIRRAKVPVICLHGLRHTFASWYMIRHDSVWDLAAILGHSNIKTTMRYAHHSKRARRKPLDMASITHNSRTGEGMRLVSNEKHGEKEWRDGRDLNPYTPKTGS